MKKKRNKIQEPKYICCEECKNFYGDTIHKYIELNRSELIKRLNQGSRFDYVFNTSNAVKIDVQINLEEDNNDGTRM